MSDRPSGLSKLSAILASGPGGRPPTAFRRAAEAAVLGLGAPFGWLALRVAWHQAEPIAEVLAHVELYAYMTLGSVLAFVLFAMRISASENKLHRANLDLSTIAVTDALTGLRNVGFFRPRMAEAVSEAARSERALSLAILDLDHFKSVNDSHGHPVGDEVLKAVAGRIHGAVRASDTAARVGGEEFAVLMPDTTVGGAQKTAERIRSAVAGEPFQTGAGPLPITISAGVAVWRGGTSEELYAAADGALYDAKAAGRNRVVLAELVAE